MNKQEMKALAKFLEQVLQSVNSGTTGVYCGCSPAIPGWKKAVTCPIHQEVPGE